MRPGAAAELAQQHRDRHTLTAPLSGPASLAVIDAHPQGAQGAHLAALLAHILMAHRGEQVLALDADIPTSALRRWLTDTPRDSLNQILTALGVRHRGAKPDQPVTRGWLKPRLAPHTAVPLLAVNPASPGPPLRPSDYGPALRQLHRWYPLILTHLPRPQPTNVTLRAARQADRILLVSDDTPDGAAAVGHTVHWLQNTAGAECANRALAVLRTSKPRKRARPEALPSTVEAVSAPRFTAEDGPSPTALARIDESEFVALQHVAATALSTVVDTIPDSQRDRVA